MEWVPHSFSLFPKPVNRSESVKAICLPTDSPGLKLERIMDVWAAKKLQAMVFLCSMIPIICGNMVFLYIGGFCLRFIAVGLKSRG
jgi:hypothetical protein